jgi:hypothetical protein
MYEIDPNRIDLAKEFKANPYGEHSPDLQYLLNLMRRPGDQPYHLLVMTEPFRRWTLAVNDPKDPGPPKLTNQVFDRLEDAEWEVFKLRWKVLAGTDLPLD